IECRKYTDAGSSSTQDVLILVNGEKEERHEVNGKVGFPFFGQMILDSMNRTETAMTQEHTFKAAELCLVAQSKAKRIE
ncbi:MAG: gfo/Idh/MocA family oxidoreductase, partial [Verrucomicrobiales bacterium]